jgi:DNA-binding transcriptional LysR family regulator
MQIAQFIELRTMIEESWLRHEHQKEYVQEEKPMNLIDLEAFVSVVDYGSIVAATAHLHLTQSAVTRRIQNLEDALGTPLLDRKTRPLQPTRAGQETYEFAKPVLSSVNDLKTGIMHGGEPSGDFRFGMSRSLGDLAIGSPIRRLRTDLPMVRIQAFVQWSGVLLERLAARTLDCAVVLLPEGSTPPSSLMSECVGAVPFTIVAAKSTRLSRPATLEELASNAWILNPHGCGARQLLESAFLQRGLPFVSAVEAEGYELQLSLISEGVGLGLVMPQVLHSSVSRRHIKPVKVKGLSLMQNVWILHSRHIGRLAPAVHCVRDAVKQQLRTH